MRDYRVLYQFVDPDGSQHFQFTTVYADDADDAEAVIASKLADDLQVSIVQTVESNGVQTGFTDAQLAAAVAEGERRALARTALESPLYVETVAETGVDDA